MSSKSKANKKAREELIKRYGAECFIEKLHLRKDTERKRYTSRGQMEKMRRLTYHHIKMRKDGGEASVENGALLSNENHMWFHQQNERDQRRMNKMFQEYKYQIDNPIILIDCLEFEDGTPVIEFCKKEKSLIRKQEDDDLER